MDNPLIHDMGRKGLGGNVRETATIYCPVAQLSRGTRHMKTGMSIGVNPIEATNLES